MEMKESAQAILEGVSKVLEIAAHVTEIVVAPEGEIASGAWIELANDMFTMFSAGSNDWLKKAEEMNKQAQALTIDGLQSRMRNAKDKLQSAQTSVMNWAPKVERALHDFGTKLETRDHYYDAKKPDGKNRKAIKLGELKRGIELAKSVYAEAMKTAGLGHRLRPLVAGLLKLHPDAATWMAEPRVGQKIIADLTEGNRNVYVNAEKRVNWSRKLRPRFEKLYALVGDALADSANK
jgi:hypothetical protein